MKKFYILLVLSILSFSESKAQDKSNELENAFALASADSSSIAVDTQNGWQFMSSYLTPVNTDSVMIEMIVEHDKSIDWTQNQLIGRIKIANLLPANAQTLSFNIIDNLYELRIESNGYCYLRLASGKLPDADPVIIPVRAVYKL